MIYTMFMDKMAPGILRLSVMDNDLDLFEGQYPVPQGVSYNSYLIEGDQLCLLDTVDARKQEEWLAGLDEVLAGRKLDYLVISHMEPDHAGSIRAITEHYPDMTLVGSAKALGMLPQFLLEVSPFHASIFFTSMGSLGIPPIVHHLYDFGNMPVFVSFGCKYHKNEVLDDGTVVRRKYIDYTVNTDERICDGFYYATTLKHLKRLLSHPEQLDKPAPVVNHDIE